MNTLATSNFGNQRSPVTSTYTNRPQSSAIAPVGELANSVQSLDFTRLRWKLENSGDNPWSAKHAAFSELEYRRFLTLKLLNPQSSLVPSKLVDAFWHEHILDTAAYAKDCHEVFGRFIHHFPYFGIYGAEDQKALGNAFDESNELYRQHFGFYPPGIDASRCEDHACHVTSECACRVEGACK